MNERTQTGSGFIFANTKTSNKQPDFTGKIEILGQEHEIAVWKRTSSDGREGVSFILQKKTAEEEF
jgi:hypothetical protein